MDKLHTRHCKACRADAPRATELERDTLLQEIPDWKLESEDGVDRLSRVFKFADFQKAFEFTARVAALAEQENHHPAILLEWGKVTVQWWTHKIKGLHTNDFIMAAKTDRLISQ